MERRRTSQAHFCTAHARYFACVDRQVHVHVRGQGRLTEALLLCDEVVQISCFWVGRRFDAHVRADVRAVPPRFFDFGRRGKRSTRPVQPYFWLFFSTKLFLSYYLKQYRMNTP